MERLAKLAAEREAKEAREREAREYMMQILKEHGVTTETATKASNHAKEEI